MIWHLHRRWPVDANACSASGIALFHNAASTSPDLSVRASDHVPDAGRRSGALPAGLRQQRAGRHTSLPLALTPVGAERLKRSDHITNVLISLHWLKVLECIQYKVAMLGYRVLYGSTPRYLGRLTRVADIPGRRTSIQPPPITS